MKKCYRIVRIEWTQSLADRGSGSGDQQISLRVPPQISVFSHLSPLTVVGAPQMTLQQYISTFPYLSLPSGNLQTPFLSIPWCYFPISSSVFLSFLLLSLSPAELSSPCQRILRCGHTIWISVLLPRFDHHALQLHSGICCEPPHSSHGLCRKCSEVFYSRHLISRSGILLSSSAVKVQPSGG